MGRITFYFLLNWQLETAVCPKQSSFLCFIYKCIKVSISYKRKVYLISNLQSCFSKSLDSCLGISTTPFLSSSQYGATCIFLNMCFHINLLYLCCLPACNILSTLCPLIQSISLPKCSLSLDPDQMCPLLWHIADSLNKKYLSLSCTFTTAQCELH